jgi:hypothetical protein
MFFNRSFFTTEGVQIVLTQSWDDYEDVVTSAFWKFSREAEAVLDQVREQVIADSLRFEFARIFPWDETNASILYLYLRAGNIWKPTETNLLYRQPPCSYYADGVRFNDGPGNSEVIAQDDGNPCVPMLTRAGVQHIWRHVTRDIAILMRARRVMTAVSSFIRATLMMSTTAKTVFSFNTIWLRYLPHMVCWETKEYARAMTPWTRSETQIHNMKTMEGCQWAMVTNKSRAFR